MSQTSELLTRAVESVTPKPLAEEKLKSGQPIRIYLGIDPTGRKLHLGHSVPLRKLRAFQEAGHHVTFLIGSFTAMIGDPSGRDKQREPLTRDQVLENFKTYKEQAALILNFDTIEVVYNHQWLEKITLVDLLNLASNFTLQQMEQRDLFQERKKKGIPIAMHEFLYPLLVAYDSVILDVDAELGGSDQLFNMLAGRTLQTAMKKRDKFVLTTKLIPGTDGRKMSKTYDNCIYLQDPAPEMYGKILAIADDLIPFYMECCTDIPMKEVAEAEKALKKAASAKASAAGGSVNPKDLKMRLARAIVTLYHSEEAAKAAEAEFEKVHKEKGTPADVSEVSLLSGKQKPQNVLLQAMIDAKVVSSKSDARRLVQQGGLKRVNEKGELEIIEEIQSEEFAKHLKSGTIFKVGTRKFFKILVPKDLEYVFD